MKKTPDTQLFDGEITLEQYRELVGPEVSLPAPPKPITQLDPNEDLTELIGGYEWLTDEEKEVLS